MSFVGDFFGGGDTLDFLAGGKADVFDLFGRQAGQTAEDAAAQQEEAFGQGISEQRRQFDLLFGLTQPSIEAGNLARDQQMALLGLLGPEAQANAQAQIEVSPGQKFIRDRQERSLLRNSAATGGLGGGNVRTALQQQAAGFAQQDLENQFNRLSSLTGGAQTGTQQIGQFGGNAVNQITSLLGQQGAANAAGQFGQQQAQAQGVNNAIGIGGALATFFSDSRLKDSINEVGKFGVLNVYTWIWKTTGEADIGFIAEDVREHFPDIVEEHNGFLRVNYEAAIERAA